MRAPTARERPNGSRPFRQHQAGAWWETIRAWWRIIEQLAQPDDRAPPAGEASAQPAISEQRKWGTGLP